METWPTNRLWGGIPLPPASPGGFPYPPGDARYRNLAYESVVGRALHLPEFGDAGCGNMAHRL